MSPDIRLIEVSRSVAIFRCEKTRDVARKTPGYTGWFTKLPMGLQSLFAAEEPPMNRPADDLVGLLEFYYRLWCMLGRDEIHQHFYGLQAFFPGKSHIRRRAKLFQLATNLFTQLGRHAECIDSCRVLMGDYEVTSVGDLHAEMMRYPESERVGGHCRILRTASLAVWCRCGAHEVQNSREPEPEP